MAFAVDQQFAFIWEIGIRESMITEALAMPAALATSPLTVFSPGKFWFPTKIDCNVDCALSTDVPATAIKGDAEQARKNAVKADRTLMVSIMEPSNSEYDC